MGSLAASSPDEIISLRERKQLRREIGERNEQNLKNSSIAIADVEVGRVVVSAIMLVVILPGDFRADQKNNGPVRTSIVDSSDGSFHC